MFKSSSKNDITRFLETVADIRVNYPIGNWELIATTLNTIFTDDGTPQQWRKRWQYWAQSRTATKNRVTRNELKSNGFHEKSAQLRKLLQNRKTLEKVMGVLEVDRYTALGMIQELQSNGYAVDYDENTKTYGYTKRIVNEKKEHHQYVGNVQEFEICVISDSHWGGRDQQLSFVKCVYDEIERRCITNVYHCGDIVDGYYRNRAEHVYNLFAIGADQQAEYVINKWPRKEGVTTHLILGNHCETHIINGGANIGKQIAKAREDMNYLGIGYAQIWLTPNCRMDLLHPLDGSSYATSYAGQKYMDSLQGGSKPNILCVGHHHKAMYYFYRNIHYFEVPALTKQSSWQQRKRLSNDSGAWFLKIKIDDDGTVVSLNAELMPQYVFHENDY